jgi:hypothetical protein
MSIKRKGLNRQTSGIMYIDETGLNLEVLKVRDIVIPKAIVMMPYFNYAVCVEDFEVEAVLKSLPGGIPIKIMVFVDNEVKYATSMSEYRELVK